MGMKITNLTEVVMAFKLTDEMVNSETREVLKAAAKQIRDDARRFAPVLHHRIERAIKVLPAQGNQYSLRLVVAVTGNIGGKSVDSYAAIVHEYEWHKRGPYTRLKGPQAGPRYLARAVEKNKRQLTQDLQAAMNRGISMAMQKSGVNSRRKRRR